MQVSRYVLEVECWDGGTPPLSSQALVHVEVLDVNDHPPRFDQSNYTAVVHEGRQAGWTVLRFLLSDADSPVHGPPFRLQVEETSFFRIEGYELQLARPLPPQSRHELRVQAYDSGSPPLAAEAHVTVLAIKKSRFRPQVQPLNVLVCSYLDDFPGGLLGTVHATDEDPYDRVSLSLSGPHASLFVLDRDDGTLRALPGLDAGSYVLNVTASDSSTPPTHAPVTVHVVAVSEELLKATVALRLTGTTSARFVAADRRLLLRAVRTALGVRLRDLVLVSVQPVPGEEQLDVLLAVQLEGGPMRAATVAARLHERHVALEAAAGLHIHILPQSSSRWNVFRAAGGRKVEEGETAGEHVDARLGRTRRSRTRRRSIVVALDFRNLSQIGYFLCEHHDEDRVFGIFHAEYITFKHVKNALHPIRVGPKDGKGSPVLQAATVCQMHLPSATVASVLLDEVAPSAMPAARSPAVMKIKRSVLDAFENDQFKMSRNRMRIGTHPELEQALLI
ncbi:hypothetical protein HPB52_022365 [Rhipicephalus sanguineus]|uniref:Cadherin domain-containing protein n=1 Tax=Rhipicephalus sanguineus TaxID=34632 RepID=A0A9D4Q8I1_RHISA|nr:hypothetical protein HPB52_022365 [Rhipicephalus sanguineus]